MQQNVRQEKEKKKTKKDKKRQKKKEEKKRRAHSLALTLILSPNNLTKKLLWKTSLLYGLIYL